MSESEDKGEKNPRKGVPRRDPVRSKNVRQEDIESSEIMETREGKHNKREVT